MKEYILTQVGPLPSDDDEIVVADPKEYPLDSYEEYTSKGIDIPWIFLIRKKSIVNSLLR